MKISGKYVGDKTKRKKQHRVRGIKAIPVEKLSLAEDTKQRIQADMRILSRHKEGLTMQAGEADMILEKYKNG